MLLTFPGWGNRLSVLPNFFATHRLGRHTVTKRDDDRRAFESAFASAIVWTSRVTTISLEMVVPTLIGYWLDQRLGTRVLFLTLGAILGFVTALRSLLRLGTPSRPSDPPT